VLLETREGFEVCGEATNGAEAIDRAKELQPDLVILDVSMPVADGFEAARVIRTFFPEMRILMFSVHNSKKLMEEARKAGAAGYLVKSEAHQLLKAIEIVLRDGHYSGAAAAYA